MTEQPHPIELPALSPDPALNDLQPGIWSSPIPITGSLASLLQAVTTGTTGTKTEQSQDHVWQIARFSAAVYLFSREGGEYSTVVKFYSQKVGPGEAQKYAQREMDWIEKAYASGLDDAPMRSVRALRAERGILFLEHVEGLTLGDVLSIRRHRPGGMRLALTLSAQLLARLHENTHQPYEETALTYALNDVRKYIDNLEQHGVLKETPQFADSIRSVVDLWERRPELADYTPCLIHGDATTANFIFPPEGGIIAIDWERMKNSDPAADLGRLIAEVTHLIQQSGGNSEEQQRVAFLLEDAYRHARSSPMPDSFASRVRFYQAGSTLRIARNGWISRKDRTSLAAQALALLSP